MEDNIKPLFTPWKIKNLEIKNRIVMTSMGGTCIFGWMEPNHFDKEAAKLLLDAAEHGAGLVLPGIAPVRDIIGGKWLYQGKGKYKQLKEFMTEFHKTGAKFFVQITAGFGRSFAVTTALEVLRTNKVLGFLAKPIINIDHLTNAPSPNPNRWSDKVPSKEMSKEEIHKIIEGFAKTAKCCQEAGVDGVEIHAVHEGYVLDEFTLPYANQRTDEYGGSFENRYRFPVEIVKAIKKTCGEDFPVSLRYSVVSKTRGFRQGALPGETYTEVGRDLVEGVKAAKYLQDAGYDMLNCDNGTYDAWYWNHPPVYMPLNCNVSEAEEVKKNVSIPVVVAGRMEPVFSADLIADKKIDAMGVARQFLADPEWVEKLREGRESDIRPCICCHSGCFNMAKHNGTANDQSLSDSAGMCRCAVNPPSMQSKRFYIKPTKHPKKIAVIGGGIGGMEAAMVARQRGHEVTIYEKSNILGGVFVPAASFDFKEKDRALLEWYRKQIKDLGVKVVFNREVKDLSSIEADKYVVAIGAKEKKLHLPGFEKGIDALDYLNGSKKVGEKVVIIGGSLTGCEIALDLYHHGKKPTIVEMQNDLITARGVCLANSSYLREFFEHNNVPVYLNTKLKEIKDNGAEVIGNDGKQTFLEADSVILAIGYSPIKLDNVKGKKVEYVGDCVSVGNILNAIWKGYEVGMKL